MGMRFKLHHFPATRSARAKWALHETVGDDFEIAQVNLYAGEQYRPDFMALNPNHNVPVLEIFFDGGERLVMLESAAIVSFLADAFPEKKLAPPAGANRAAADYRHMLHFAAAPMDMMLWQVRIHEHILGPEDRDERTAARYRAKFAGEVEPQAAARLSEHEFICGDQFTAADIVMGHNVGWAQAYGLCADDIFVRYRRKLAERPAYRAAFSDVGGFTVAPPKRPEGMKSPFNG